jgi:transposase-like protein
MTMPIEQIEATTATQVRVKLHNDVIDLYEQDIRNGAAMPPVTVFAEKGSARHILADGFHRLVAHVNAELEEIEVEIYEGGMHDELAHALQANRTHGLRRSNADKINAVKMALKDPVFSALGQQEIADLCGVSRETVSRVNVRETTGRTAADEKKAQPKKPEASDHRPTLPEPTQEEIELGELRGAMKAIKAFPYPGEDAVKLDLDKDDVADLEYVSTWCAHAVLACRSEKANG